MGFTRSTTDISVHQKLGDYPNQDNGLTPEELKKRFDYPAKKVQEDLNNLEMELEAMSGAGSIGAMPLDDEDVSSNNIQAKMQYLKKEIQNTTLGEIPDGTITESKIETNFANEIAKKNGELQTGLNSEKLDGSTKQEIIDSAGAYSDIRTTTIKGYVGVSLNTWEKAIKGEEQNIELDNSRHFLIKITPISVPYNKNYENLFLYDAVLGSAIPLVEHEIALDGSDFSSISPKVHTISLNSGVVGSKIGVGFAFTGRETRKLKIQLALFNTSSSILPGNEEAIVRIDVTAFLSKI